MTTMLVTGADGFVGSNLVRHLTAAGHAVVGVDIKRGVDARAELDEIADGVFDGVAHLAANVDTTVAASPALSATNVELSRDLAAACQVSGIPFVFASSASVYGSASAGTSLVVGDELQSARCTGPLSPYARSKLDAETAIRDAHPSSLVLRLSNVFGPGDDHKRAMSCIATQIATLHAQQLPINLFRDTLTAARDYVPVRRVCQAFESGLRGSGAGQILNCGSGQALSFADLLRLLCGWSGRQAHVNLIDNPYKAQYQYWTQLDMSDATRALELAPNCPGPIEGIREHYERAVVAASDRDPRCR